MENLGGNGVIPQNEGQPNRIPNDNLDQIVERVLNRHGFEVGRNERPYFVSTFPDYITQVELPRGAKVPKFLKFSGELDESTVEHIARYLVECGDLANNEYLKMKYFLSSLTKHAFTWFTTLPPNSINTWAQLESSFHEHFFKEETKVSIVDLMNVKRQSHETLDDYLNRFRQLKSRCYTNVPEHELVKIAAIGLNFSIRKKLVNEQLRDMAQLAEKVRRIEQIKLEKERLRKFDRRVRKEKVAHLENAEIGEDANCEISSEDFEVNIAELRPGPTYQCQMLKLRDNMEGSSTKKYSFDVTKTDKIFDILLKDKQIALLENHKISPFEQRKGKKFCKYHNMYGHWTNNYVFDGIKAYLAHPPVLAPPSKGKQLKLYISASDSTVADMLAQDDDNGIERVIYYLSRMLVEAENRYTPLEKLCLSLYVTCTKLKYYLRPYDAVIFCRSNVIKYMLCKPVLHSRIGKWALALTEYSLTFEPLKATKGQVIADFLADHSEITKEINYLTNKPWEFFFDGSKHELGIGIGLLIISSEGIPTKLSLKTNRGYSNNETEYQALITRLEILKEFGAKNVVIRGDSQHVIKQLTQEYKCLNEKLIEFKIRAVQLLNAFDEVELQHVSRHANTIANELAQVSSAYKVSKECVEFLIHTENELCHLESFSVSSKIGEKNWSST
uniref:Retrovirus-related Pol polyprotein from transposon opus n=1 Tax=Cajanus cajan TaxID=3821 RepID=A0A151SFQ9_CAJCA|nr:Retrovirus-related Pol polyprotein from transposon opus [Cajanus cajan]